MAHLKGQRVFTKYRRPDGNWAICRFRILDSEGYLGTELDLVGNIQEYDSQDIVNLIGEWKKHPKYGDQFEVSDAYLDIRQTPEGARDFLSTYVKGIGPTLAKALHKHFGDQLIDVLGKHPERLTEVRGISENKANHIHNEWVQQTENLPERIYLAECGFSESMSRRIIRHFGGHVQEVIKSNPYRLTEVDGIGFLRADEAALKMGWPKHSPERTRAAMEYLLREATSSGHTFLNLNELHKAMQRIAKVSKTEVDAAVRILAEEKRVVFEETKIDGLPRQIVYLPYLYWAECVLAERVSELIEGKPYSATAVSEALAKVEGKQHVTYSELQKQAIIQGVTYPLSIINGGPGTGKTTTVKGLIHCAEELGLKVVLAAPTGRAAKRLSEVTGKEAQTIHRLLGLDRISEDDQFAQANKTVDADILVMDETSMNDLLLQEKVMSNVPTSCSIVMIGDVDQLPAVGPGMVLRDFIESGVVKVTTLDTIFRQAEGSLIIRNAHRIRQGLPPQFPPKGVVANSYLMSVPRSKDEDGKSRDDLKWARQALVKMCNETLPGKYQCDPIRDIQVLVPTRKNEAGAEELNRVLQEVLNPDGQVIHLPNGQSYRTGDRVMQFKNDYKLNLFNGDVGFVRGVDWDTNSLQVEFDGAVVNVPWIDEKGDDHTKYLHLAYAQTIHKSQGSEYKYCVIVMTMHHWSMLDRNLLYTANTRAKELCLYIASQGAVQVAAKKSNAKERNSLLKHRIRRAAMVDI